MMARYGLLRSPVPRTPEGAIKAPGSDPDRATRIRITPAH
jgi:hypothetical protein